MSSPPCTRVASEPCGWTGNARSSPGRRPGIGRRSRSRSPPRAPPSSSPGATPSAATRSSRRSTAAGGTAHVRPPPTSRDEDACTGLVDDRGRAARRAHRPREQRRRAATRTTARSRELTTAAWEASLRVNLTAPMWLRARRDPAHARAPGTASIVNISTRQAERASPGLTAYIASQGRAQRSDPRDRGRLRRRTGSAATRSAPATCSTTGATPTSRPSAARALEGMHLTRLGEADDVADAAVYLASRRVGFVTGVNLQLDGGSSIARGAHARLSGRCIRARRVSAICTFRLGARRRPRVLARARHHERRASRSRSSSATAGTTAPRSSSTRSDAGCGSTNLIGLGPFHLARPDALGRSSRSASSRSLDAAVAVGARVPRVHDRPAAPAAVGRGRRRARAGARARCSPRRARAASPFAIEHTNSLRVDVGFVHTLARRGRPRPPARHRRVHGDQRVLGRARPRDDDPRRRRPHPARAGERLHGRHASRRRNRLVPGDGDIPLAPHPAATSSTPGYPGCFDLELIGPAIDAEGYDAAVPRAVDALGRAARASSAPDRLRPGGPHGTRRGARPARAGSPDLRSRATRVEVARPATRRPRRPARAAAPPTPARSARPRRRLDDALLDDRGLARRGRRTRTHPTRSSPGIPSRS